jgi:hypothetical protein
MQFLLLVAEPRAGRTNGTRIRWEDVDDGSDGGCSATARPHGKQNTGRANEDERNLKLCLTLVEFAKWRAVVGCHSSATAHLLIAAIHSHRVLSWQALAFGVFSRARCGERLHPSTSFAWSQRAHLGSQSQRSRRRCIGACLLRSGYLRACDDGMPLCSPLVACRQP